MAHNPIHLTNGFLLTQICKLHRTCSNQQLEAIGMYKGQELIMCELWQQNGLTQSDLVDRLAVQPSTLTNALNSMEKSGLVQRKPDDNDQRVSRVYLTEHASEIWPQVQQVWDDMEARTFANMTIEERVLLRRLLMQVYDNLSNMPD